VALKHQVALQQKTAALAPLQDDVQQQQQQQQQYTLHCWVLPRLHCLAQQHPQLALLRQLLAPLKLVLLLLV